jgi:hypothetical protein
LHPGKHVHWTSMFEFIFHWFEVNWFKNDQDLPVWLFSLIFTKPQSACDLLNVTIDFSRWRCQLDPDTTYSWCIEHVDSWWMKMTHFYNHLLFSYFPSFWQVLIRFGAFWILDYVVTSVFYVVEVLEVSETCLKWQIEAGLLYIAHDVQQCYYPSVLLFFWLFGRVNSVFHMSDMWSGQY